MKIGIVSDLHLEFADIELKNDQNVDVLVLSGDIMVAQDLKDYPAGHPLITGLRADRAESYREFMRRVSRDFPNVIYVAGNHEFYHGKFNQGLKILEQEAAEFGISFLEDRVKVIDGVTFVGCSLWTDMNKSDSITLFTMKSMMNDYKVIVHDRDDNYSKLRPEATVSRHHMSVRFIEHVARENQSGKIVVCGHHAPSKASTHPRYADDEIMNGAYSSDLSELMLDNPQIKLWTHGHTHNPFDYMIGSTRVVCNPRGYHGYETDSVGYKVKTVEI